MPHASDPGWVELSDEELLKTPLRDLGLKIEDTSLQEAVDRLHTELESAELLFKPKVYLGDEWFSPEGYNAIAIPFYLAHPRLISLQKKIMLEAEGDGAESCMKLLRHEAGHCFDHVFRFSKRRKWRQIFGSPDEEYAPENYRPKPYSRGYVKHIDRWYAQAHPDEDFAETFAVWMTPGSDWEKHYRTWPQAYAKLKYVDRLAREVRGEKSKGKGVIPKTLPFDASRSRLTLEVFYQRRKRENAEQYPDFFDIDLRRIFDGGGELSLRTHSALRFMKRNRKLLVDSLSHMTGEKKFTVSALIKRLELRCQELQLRVSSEESRTCIELGVYLSSIISHHLFTGKFKRSV